MSGHNRWKQIKEKKGKSDAYKSKAFAKYAKLIALEAKKSGGNREAPGVKSIIERARKENMPNDNIERALKKATEAGAMAMEKIVYEAYGPGGVAIIIEALTDNRNKAVQEIKTVLSKNELALASPGSATWAFSNKGGSTSSWEPTSTVEISEADLEKLEKIVEDLENCEEVQEVFTNAE